jgi:hypothetical protein
MKVTDRPGFQDGRFAAPIAARIVLLSGVLIALFSARAAPDEGDPPSRQDAMRSRAEDILVSVKTGDDRTPAKLLAEPVLSYTDRERNFPDATLWGWQVAGRPVAIAKIERVVSQAADRRPGWQYCFVSLTEELIEARWADRHHWRAAAPGIRWRAFSNAPQPAGSETTRLFQMKSLARQFEGRIDNPTIKVTEQMRLLPNPLVRYASPQEGLRDGAVFGLTSKGTNPDTLLLIELRDGEDDSPAWRFGLVGMTGDAVQVRRAGEMVWSKDVTTGPGDHRSWIWYVEWGTLPTPDP